MDKVKTPGEVEAAICEGISRFEQDYMGRGPKDIRAHLLGDLLVDLRGGSFKFLHFQTAQKPDVVNHPLVGGSGGGDVDGSVDDFKGQNAVAFGKFGGQRANDFRRNCKPDEAAQPPLKAITFNQGASRLDGISIHTSHLCVISHIDYGPQTAWGFL